MEVLLLKLAEEFNTGEITINTMTYSRQDRLRSFELLAEAFELKKQ